MANIKVRDRVKVSSTSTGTGAFTLSDTPDPGGFQNFSILDGLPTYYTIVNPNTDEWETGQGTFTQATLTLTRTVVYDGSNGTSPVNFGAGTKTVFCSEPARKASPGGWVLLSKVYFYRNSIRSYDLDFEGVGTTTGVDSRFSEYKLVLPPVRLGWFLTFTSASGVISGTYLTRFAVNTSNGWYNYNYSSTSGIYLYNYTGSQYGQIEVTIAGVRLQNGSQKYTPAVHALCRDSAYNSSTTYYPPQTLITGKGAFLASDISGIRLRNAYSTGLNNNTSATARFYGVI